MCLAIPGTIVQIDGSDAALDMLGVRRSISLALTPEAKVGDWVLVHAGFSIQIVDEQEARQTIELVRELDELAREGMPGSGIEATDQGAPTSEGDLA